MKIKLSYFAELAVLGAFVCLFLMLAAHAMGIDAFDESSYLSFGVTIRPSAFYLRQEWSPLYGYWFKLLARFCHDPLLRYFLSWGLLVAAVALLPSLLKIAGGWMHALLVITLPFTLISPRVSLFASILLLAAMCLLIRRGARPLSETFIAVTACSFIAAFARPEFAYGVFLGTAGLVVMLLVEWLRPAIDADAPGALAQKHKPVVHFFLAAAGVAFALCLCWCMHFAMVHSAASDRSGMAFVQHYNLRASEQGMLKPGDSPYTSFYAQNLFGLDPNLLPNQLNHSLKDYARARPRLFLGHLATNLFDYRTIDLLLPVFAMVLWPWLRKERRALRPASIFLLCMVLPPLSGIVVIYPRDHYAITLLPCLFILGIQELRPQRWITPTVECAFAVATILIAFISLTLSRLEVAPFPWQRTNLAAAQCMRGVDRDVADRTSPVFDATFGLANFTGSPRVTGSPELQITRTDFEQWINRNHPAWITTNDILAGRYVVSLDDLDRYLTRTLHYTRHDCPTQAAMTVYTRNDAPRTAH